MTTTLNKASIDELYATLRDVTNDPNVVLFEDKISSLDFDKIDNDVATTNETISERFLKPSNILSWGILDTVQDVPGIDFLKSITSENDVSRQNYDYKELLTIPQPISRSNFYFKRNGIDGKISGYKEEVSLKEISNANASNSLSLTRKLNHQGNTLRGNTTQLPFTPGGISAKTINAEDVSPMMSATKLLHKDGQGLFDIPQGFDRGIIPNQNISDENEIKKLKELNEIDNIEEVERELQEVKDLEVDKAEMKLRDALIKNQNKNDDLTEIDQILPMDIDFGRSVGRAANALRRKEWAHVVDLNHKIDNFSELVPNPARTWPFELDTFQKEAVYHLEQGDSVFVAAHTSAGKTVVAEYAIAMAKRNMTKTIYTSPIKALSNQKFRDFKETFEDVEIGLITGDVQINPEANCLIMTTEILRSMLYRGADLIRDVEFVIFDEVHYVNDQDRGVVWEEVIIMLPQHVKFILLSATVPNTYEFASWIGRTKQKNIYVISTPKRPVPLQINIWAKDNLIPVISPNREFLESNFKKHKDLLSGSKDGNTSMNSSSQRGGIRGGIRGGSRGGSRGGNRGGSRGGSQTKGSRGAGAVGSNKRQFFKRSGPGKKTWSNLINFLKKQDLLPMVTFVFSKKRCEEYADWLEGINFCNSKEKSQIHMFIEKSITRLKKDDRELPQILKIRSLLERGIAVHHGGLLPIVKELIEILFAKGFIKVLFATETFAMGLNLPTRTVVFSEIQKHDGTKLRDLTPGEFTQMSGRAGRRGLDKTGTVIIMAYEPLALGSFKEVTLGIPTKLESQFRLTYNMVLNLLRIEALKVEEMIKYSFSENTNQTSHPEHEKEIKKLQAQLDTITIPQCAICDIDIDKLLDACVRYDSLTAEIMSELNNSGSIFRILKAGRLVVYKDKNSNYVMGFIFRNDSSSNSSLIMAVTEPNNLDSGEANHLPYIGDEKNYLKKNFNLFKEIDFYMDSVPFSSVVYITPYILKVPFTRILDKDTEALEELQKEIKIILKYSRKLKEATYKAKGNLKVHQGILEKENIKREIFSYKSINCPNLAKHFAPRYAMYSIESEISHYYHLMSDENLNLLPDYERRLDVLKSTGFIDQNHNVMLKGRVACEINTGYELVLTELILDNFLGEFEPEEIVALLSVFVYEGRTKEEEAPVVTPRLLKGKQRIQEIYSRMLTVYETHQIPLTQDEAEFLEKKRFALMNVVYEWARGLSFKEIMEISPEAEGTVVRVITRLDEICREVKTSAIIIGNTALHLKMSRAQELIKRDIVFAASLYL